LPQAIGRRLRSCESRRTRCLWSPRDITRTRNSRSPGRWIRTRTLRRDRKNDARHLAGRPLHGIFPPCVPVVTQRQWNGAQVFQAPPVRIANRFVFPSDEEPMTVGEFILRISVPHGYVQDHSTRGPVLPEGWTGDAWQAQDLGRGYFLRAWSDATGQVATIQSETSYEEASGRLRQKIARGGDWTASLSERS
jgi:hypothetical protein